MSTARPGLNRYQQLGVRPVIAAGGPITKQGGSRLRPAVMAAMNDAAGVLVDMDELNRRAGEILAYHTGAEAGVVSSGAAGALVLQAAAVVAGNNPANMARLPDTRGMKNEIIIHRCHRFPYDQCYRSVGAHFVEIGDGRLAHPWELESAFSERTAAVAYLYSPFISRNALPFEQVRDMAHEHGVPVIVNAASFLPPRANLKRFIAAGADMVIFSGGKVVRGPQGTGILVGRRDLIEAAFANASPHEFFGRSLKVAKEEIVGLVEALEIFVNEDEMEQTRRYRSMVEQVVQACGNLSGLRVSLEHDEHDFLLPTAVLRFTSDWRGRSRNDIYEALVGGDPPIYLQEHGPSDQLGVDPFNVTDDQLDLLVSRLREELDRKP